MSKNPDVLVIGGGLMGLLAARELRLAGRRVVLADKSKAGTEASWASAGMVGEPGPKDKDPMALLEARSVEIYPRLAAELLEETGLDISYLREGWLSLAWTEAQEGLLQEGLTRAKASGQESRILGQAELREMEPSLAKDIRSTRLMPGGQVDNRILVQALIQAEKRGGLEILEGVTCASLPSKGPLKLDLGGKTVTSGAVLITTGAWSGLLEGAGAGIPVKPQRGQILAFRPQGRPLKRVVLEAEDFPYLVPRKDGRTLAGATREDVGFDRSLTAQGVGSLIANAIRMMPGLSSAPLAETWTGFRPRSRDGLPLIGSWTRPDAWLLTGHGPAGVGPAPASAKLLAQLLCGEKPLMDPAPFAPARFL